MSTPVRDLSETCSIEVIMLKKEEDCQCVTITSSAVSAGFCRAKIGTPDPSARWLVPVVVLFVLQWAVLRENMRSLDDQLDQIQEQFGPHQTVSQCFVSVLSKEVLY
jgi:hypothetical protein